MSAYYSDNSELGPHRMYVKSEVDDAQEPQEPQQAQKRKHEEVEVEDDYDVYIKRRKELREQMLVLYEEFEAMKDEINRKKIIINEKIKNFNEKMKEYNRIIRPIVQPVVQPVVQPYKPVYYSGSIKPNLHPGETAIHVDADQFSEMKRRITSHLEQQQQQEHQPQQRQRRMPPFSLAAFKQPIPQGTFSIPQRTPSIPQGFNPLACSHLDLDSAFPVNTFQHNKPRGLPQLASLIPPFSQPISQPISQRYFTVDKIDEIDENDKILFEK